MIFSSITFIYFFLPLLLLIYFIAPKKYKNHVLFIFSMLFYFYGEPKYIIVLLISCVVNYLCGKYMEKFIKYKKFFLWIAISYNILQLMYFKYVDFFIENFNNIFNIDISLLHVIMPIGISFFTFQTLSYVIDVYKGDVKASNSFLNFSTYVSLFPQLVAGPIVRYKTIDDELKSRKVTFECFCLGIKLFIIGLSKKVLLANILGEMGNSLGDIDKTFISSWLDAIGYTLQIYFDFSGYSDMAIGLGLMFGFHFLKNFNYPLIANSITDFWRRWHMSLSSFFKDYVYIPLGGSKCSKFKFYRNIFIVWFLTGFWHGAAWNFILWGLYFGVILIIEKVFLGNFIRKSRVLKYFYTLFIVIVSFVIFKNDNMNELFINLDNMFNASTFINKEVIYYLRSYILVLIIAIISATPICKLVFRKYSFFEPVYYMFLLIVSTAYLIDSSFNPFLYFRF